MARLGRIIAFAAALALTGCAGYDVETLGNSADARLSRMGNGDTITFGALLDLNSCERVTVVGPYMSDERKQELIGEARVDLSRTDQFVVVAAFEGNEMVRAVRMSRTPLDLDWLAPRSFSCATTIRSDQGRAAVGTGDAAGN